MKKVIVVNADDLESRVAILEDGELSELHVERELRMVGNIYKARVVSVLPGMDAAFADIGLEKNVFLCADDVGFASRDGVTSTGTPRSASIAQRIKEHQEVVVQIVRAPVGGKGARATTRLALPGRYLVLLLYEGRQVGISRKIEERKERERLRRIGESIRPEGMGLIIRTEAEGKQRKDLETDLKVLMDLRGRILARAEQVRVPALLHQDLTLTYQVIRDVFTDDVQSLVIDSKSVYDNAAELVKVIAPHLRKRVRRYRGMLPIFHKYGIEGEIERLLRRRVWLQAGGYISIDQAEAFTAIDVNTGRYTGTTGLADTILRTNLEAAEEIARQLRLRDLGGIIVIDFIDMERVRHRQRVVKAFQEALKRDRQKTKIVHLSPLGLVEMTRKRRGESLLGILMETCPHCAGIGRVRNSLTVALKIEREVRRIAAEDKAQAFVVRAAPRVATIMIGEDGQRAAALEKIVGRPTYIRGDERLSFEDQEITATTAARVAHELKMYHQGEEITVDHLEPREPAAGEEVYGWSDGYRVLVEGVVPGAEPCLLVLSEADHSFGRGQVRSSQMVAEEMKEAPRRRLRTRGRKKRPTESRAETTAETYVPLMAEPLPALAPAEELKPALEHIAKSKGRQARERRRMPGRDRKKKVGRAQQAPTAVSESQAGAPSTSEPVGVVSHEAEPTSALPQRTGLLRRGARKKTGPMPVQPASARLPLGELPHAAGPTAAEQGEPARRPGLLRRGARLMRARR